MLRLSPRQRGAFWLLLALLGGRVLDRFDLPFEAVAPTAFHAADSSRTPGDASSGTPADSSDTEASGSGAGTGPEAAARPSVPLAINQAGVSELQALPRVGPVLAARIVAHREANGPFRSLQDLQRVPGIGPRTAARLAPLLRFD